MYVCVWMHLMVLFTPHESLFLLSAPHTETPYSTSSLSELFLALLFLYVIPAISAL
jgi:hypothetical protein